MLSVAIKVVLLGLGSRRRASSACKGIREVDIWNTNTLRDCMESFGVMTAETPASVTTEVDAVRRLATIPVWHPSRPSAASLLGVSKSTAYNMARDGELPTIRCRSRVVVRVSGLLRMLGEEVA